MNTRDETYILALDQCRSITKAAEQLHVTQPTLSIFLSNLESRLGVTLFQRIGKKLIPTSAGQAYVRQAQRILALERDCQLELLPYIKGARGELHIGSTYLGSISLIPPLMRRMKQMYPQLQLYLHNDESARLEALLADGTLDVIYSNYPIESDQFHCEKICEDHLLAVLPQGHPASEMAQLLPGMSYPYLNLKLVEDETFFLMRSDRAIRRRVDLAFEYANVHPAHIHPLQHIQLGCQMAAEGLGVAFSMENYVIANLYTRPVSYFRVGNPDTCSVWYAAYRESHPTPPYLTDFIRLLRECFC